MAWHPFVGFFNQWLYWLLGSWAACPFLAASFKVKGAFPYLFVRGGLLSRCSFLLIGRRSILPL
jgi:hypothetical protein